MVIESVPASRSNARHEVIATAPVGAVPFVADRS
jgi:hypothetical protein